MSPEKDADKGTLGRLADAVAGRVLDTVDIDIILEHVDVDALLDRIDVNHFLDRIDVNRLMARVDVNSLLSDVDLEALVRRSGVPAIIAESSSQFAGSAIDVLRRQLTGLDAVAERIVDSAARRRGAKRATAPAKLLIGERA